MVAVGLTAVAPAAADPPVQVTGASLTPSFDEAITDYTVQCPSRPITLSVDAPAPASVAINGGSFRDGSFNASVDLHPEQGFNWVVRRGATSTTYRARCLPSDFPSFTVQRPGQPQAQWYIVAPTARLGQASTQNYAIIFDNRGVPVWWYKDADFRPFDVRLLPNDHLVWAPVLGIYREHALDSTAVLHTWQTSGSISDFHDLQMLPNGNALIIGYPRRSGVDVSQFKPGITSATVIDGEIQEVARDGHLVWDWNSKDHIALNETSSAWWAQQNEPYDIVHMNSVEDDGDGIIFSARHLDAVYRIDKATGDIDWKLGGSTTSRSLTVSGDPFGSYPFGGQHDARRLSDGTVTVHDNATLQNRSPRAARYEIDPDAMTAKMVESVSDPQVTSSLCCGGARKLPTGHWVMSWGADPIVEEMTSAGQRVFSLNWADEYFSYRVEPLMPGRLPASTLYAGMDKLHPRIQVKINGSTTAGSPFSVTAKAIDSAGNVLTDFNGPATWSDSSGQLSPGAPSAFVNGVSTTAATISGPVKGDRITVSSGGVTGQSAPFSVIGPMAALKVNAPSSVTRSTPFTLKTIAVDSAGNQVSSYSGSATWSDVSGKLSPSVPSGFVNGISTTTATIATSFHNDRISVTSGGITGHSGVFNVLGPVASISIRLGGPVHAGSAFAVTAKAFDSAGNMATGYSGSATWSDASGRLSPATPANFVNGVSTTSATIARAYHGDRITVTTAGVSGQSGTFSVFGPIAAIRVRAEGPITAGTPFKVKAKALDSAGNDLTDYDAAATWSDLSGQLSPSRPSDFVNGISTTTATIAVTHHDDRITVNSGGAAGQSGAFDVQPGPASFAVVGKQGPV